MGVVVADLTDAERAEKVSWWNWRPTLVLIEASRLVDAERLALMGYNGSGVEITRSEARAIAEFLEERVLAHLAPGDRVRSDLSITDVPDDGTFYREDIARNYSASYDWLQRFVRFCLACDGFTVV
jgi:hypothetical protein